MLLTITYLRPYIQTLMLIKTKKRCSHPKDCMKILKSFHTRPNKIAFNIFDCKNTTCGDRVATFSQSFHAMKFFGYQVQKKRGLLSRCTCMCTTWGVDDHGWRRTKVADLKSRRQRSCRPTRTERCNAIIVITLLASFISLYR